MEESLKRRYPGHMHENGAVSVARQHDITNVTRDEDSRRLAREPAPSRVVMDGNTERVARAHDSSIVARQQELTRIAREPESPKVRQPHSSNHNAENKIFPRKSKNAEDDILSREFRTSETNHVLRKVSVSESPDQTLKKHCDETDKIPAAQTNKQADSVKKQTVTRSTSVPDDKAVPAEEQKDLVKSKTLDFTDAVQDTRFLTNLRKSIQTTNIANSLVNEDEFVDERYLTNLQIRLLETKTGHRSHRKKQSVIRSKSTVECPCDKLHRQHPNCVMDNVLHELSQGEQLHKIKGGGILYTRTFFLDTHGMKLFYKGSQKKLRKKRTSWNLSAIEEIREGEKDYAKRLDYHDKNRAFCVVFGTNHEVLYLLAPDFATKDKWVKGLRYALQMDQYVKQKETSNIWVRQAFDEADKNSDERLDFEEVMRLLKSLNADMEKSYVRQMFDTADTRRTKGERPTLDREEFVKFYNILTERPEIEEIFLKYSTDFGHLTPQTLLNFLVKEQKEEDVTIDRCKEIIVVYEPQNSLKQMEQMSLIGFRSFLVSQQQHLFNRSHRRVYQDMTQPMVNYFINSSHNTYLAEDQLKGPSKVECYISALKKGCRCVELDCWDGSDGEPVIFHGYTLTSKINFYDVIRAIKDYAFQTSPYPVTLSIENHCSLDQQTKMAEYLQDVFGDMLYCPHSPPEVAPSPHELKEKIIVKGKKLPWAVQQQNHHQDDDDDSSDEDEALEQAEIEHKPKKKSKLKLSPLLSQAVGMKSVHFHSVQDVPSAQDSFSVVSIAEKKIMKMVDSDLDGVCRYTRKMLIRTYPAGSRTDSSNYNPVPTWVGGCQIVALNFQTGGVEMNLNAGRFLDNGNAGYVLKPKCLMNDRDLQYVIGNGPTPFRKQLTIKVISGFQIPRPKDNKKGEVIDPYLKIEIFGVQRDTQDRKTTVIKNNGFNPMWNETFVFTVEVPQLALVRLTVSDSDRYVDDFIGSYVVPFNSIVQGYRHFPLYDKNGDQFAQGRMFVHVTINDTPPQ